MICSSSRYVQPGSWAQTRPSPSARTRVASGSPTRSSVSERLDGDQPTTTSPSSVPRTDARLKAHIWPPPASDIRSSTAGRPPSCCQLASTGRCGVGRSLRCTIRSRLSRSVSAGASGSDAAGMRAAVRVSEPSSGNARLGPGCLPPGRGGAQQRDRGPAGGDVGAEPGGAVGEPGQAGVESRVDERAPGVRRGRAEEVPARKRRRWSPRRGGRGKVRSRRRPSRWGKRSQLGHGREATSGAHHAGPSAPRHLGGSRCGVDHRRTAGQASARTSLGRAAASPTTSWTTSTASSRVSPAVQPPVASCSSPTASGPVAATR